jgi:hypothetical protein
MQDEQKPNSSINCEFRKMLNMTLKQYQSSVRLTKVRDETSTIKYTKERDEIIRQNKETLKMVQEEAKEKIR